MLSDGFLSSLSDVWGHLELLEMQKLGIKLTQVEDAYRHVATLPIADLLFDSSFKVQTENIRNIVNTLPTCPLHQKVVATELGLASYVVYDTQDTTQACVARVMSLLLQNQRWLVQMCDNEFQEIENAVRVSAVALIFMTGNLIKNPMCVGFLALLDSRDMPMVTVLSQSDFPSSDKKWLAKLGAGRAFTPSDKEIMNNTISGAGGVRPTDMEIADTQESLFKILAWRFNPEESDIVMDVMCQRIIERMKLANKRHEEQAAAGTKPAKKAAKPVDPSQLEDVQVKANEVPNYDSEAEAKCCCGNSADWAAFLKICFDLKSGFLSKMYILLHKWTP